MRVVGQDLQTFTDPSVLSSPKQPSNTGKLPNTLLKAPFSVRLRDNYAVSQNVTSNTHKRSFLFYLFKYTLWQTEMFWKLKWCHDAEINVTSADICAIRRSPHPTPTTPLSLPHIFNHFWSIHFLWMEFSAEKFSIKSVINWDFHLSGSFLTLLLKCGASMRMSITGTWFGPL